MNTTLDKLLCAKYAAFDDYDEDAGSSECYGETRKEILKEIEDWAEDQDGKCIFWLSGMAGSGKSTIARTVARKFKQKDYLGASFFFKAGQKLRGDSKALFTTLADQLASVMPSLKPSICKAIENDPRISEKNPAHQWEDLIFKPLQDFKCGLFKSPVLILVIDALDECRSQRSYDSHIPIILDLFYQIKNIQNIRVRVFITSRPELEITKKFPEIRHRNLKLDQPEDLDNTRRDISIFLTAKLRKVADIQVPPFGSDWPGNDMMPKLPQKAGHLFIYATNISHFLQKSSYPNRGIGRILEGTSKSSLPTKDLDNMYTLIVQAAIAEQEEEDVQEFLKVVGSIIVLSEPLSRSSLSHLLDIDRNVIYNILKPLHSVL
jgi:NACHT domain